MNCKWFEVLLFFLFLASKNLYAPKMLRKTKGKIIFVKSGGGGRTDSAAIRSTAFHIVKTLCRHPAE